MRLLAGDALALPFRDGSFDAVTISFGLRNIHQPRAALTELLRVTRPGGRLVVCEFSHPVNRAFRTVYLSYLMRALPAVARRVASNPVAYDYLAESIRAWPDQAGLAEWISEAGLAAGPLAQPVRWHRRAPPRVSCRGGQRRRCRWGLSEVPFLAGTNHSKESNRDAHSSI